MNESGSFQSDEDFNHEEEVQEEGEIENFVDDATNIDIASSDMCELWKAADNRDDESLQDNPGPEEDLSIHFGLCDGLGLESVGFDANQNLRVMFDAENGYIHVDAGLAFRAYEWLSREANGE